MVNYPYASHSKELTHGVIAGEETADRLHQFDWGGHCEVEAMTETLRALAPTVVFALRNTANIEIYQWAADVRTEPLAAHDRTRFVARIPTPPKSIRSVLVRFAKAR